jgi:AcrR family transcriptional regulator
VTRFLTRYDHPVTTTGRRYRDQSAEERHASRRAKIVDAAVELFGSDAGYAGTSIEQLCAAAGVSTRNFYEHFKNREILLLALHDELNGRAFEAVGQAIATVDPLDLEARAHAGIRAYFEVMTSDKRWARIALVESVGVSPTAEQHRRDAQDRFATLIGFEADRLAAANVIPQRDFGLTAVAIVGAINGLINTWTANEDFVVDDVVTTAVEVFVAALTR